MASAGDQTFVLADATSLRMIHLLRAMDQDEFLKDRHRPCEELARSVLCKLPKDCLLEPNESSSILLEWRRIVEDRIRDLCGSESKQFWLHLTRRIRPDPEVLGVTPETAWLARATLNLAILKYGLPVGRPFVKVPPRTDLRYWMKGEDSVQIEEPNPAAEPFTLLPKTLTRADCIAAHQLEELVYELCLIAAGLRRAWKGGRLQLQNGVAMRVGLDPDTEQLVKLYDARMSKYNTILSGFGLVADIGDVLEQHHRGDPVDTAWLLWLPVWNLEGIDVASLFDPRAGVAFISNYLLLPATMEPWYRCARLFRDEIQEMWRVSPEQIVCFLVASSQRHILICRQDIALKYHLWQRGYVVIDQERYTRQVAEAYRECYGELFGGRVSLRAATREVAQVLAVLTYSEADFEKIDLWTRSGGKVLHPMGDGLHLDYSMVPVFLAHVLRAIPVTGGSAGMAKGTEFERQAKEIIRERIPGVAFWDAPDELEFEDGSKRELDLGVVLDEAIFVCECKSHAVPPGFERGEPGELWNRQQKLRGALVKANTLAQKLAAHPQGRNFALSQGIKFVTPCVLTPFPEYLPERSNTFFFDDGNWPRVCVPEEFAEFLEKFRAASSSEQPLVYMVAQN